jgi:ribosomal protein S13
VEYGSVFLIRIVKVDAEKRKKIQETEDLQVKDWQRMIANGCSVESVLRLAAVKLVSAEMKLEWYRTF